MRAYSAGRRTECAVCRTCRRLSSDASDLLWWGSRSGLFMNNLVDRSRFRIRGRETISQRSWVVVSINAKVRQSHGVTTGIVAEKWAKSRPKHDKIHKFGIAIS